MRESRFQGILSARLKTAGALVLNVHGHEFQSSGWPDLIVFSRHWTGGLELKVGVGKLSTLQKIMLKRLNEHGFPSFVLRHLGDEIQLETEEKFVKWVAKWNMTGGEILGKLKNGI